MQSKWEQPYEEYGDDLMQAEYGTGDFETSCGSTVWFAFLLGVLVGLGFLFL